MEVPPSVRQSQAPQLTDEPGSHALLSQYARGYGNFP